MGYKKLYWVAVLVIVMLLGVMLFSVGSAQTGVPCALTAEGNYVYNRHSYSANTVWLTCKYKKGDWRPPTR